ncbi:isoc1, partial [Acrasis kona]
MNRAKSVIGKLALNKSFFLLCDVQDRFRPLIHNFESVLWVANTMSKASNILNVPMIITEQYPKALGHTCKEIELPPHQRIFEKKKFSMLDDEVSKHLEEEESFKERRQAVLFGIEAHVCVQQTALELIERDYEVHIIADGTSSQRKFDRDVAFDRMRQAGAFVTTSESALFQLVGSADFTHFKAISSLSTSKTSPRPDQGS